ncbi:hypothetical protein N2152v2_004199 [Parachlorella kessleri]
MMFRALLLACLAVAAVGDKAGNRKLQGLVVSPTFTDIDQTAIAAALQAIAKNDATVWNGRRLQGLVVSPTFTDIDQTAIAAALQAIAKNDASVWNGRRLQGFVVSPTFTDIDQTAVAAALQAIAKNDATVWNGRRLQGLVVGWPTFTDIDQTAIAAAVQAAGQGGEREPAVLRFAITDIYSPPGTRPHVIDSELGVCYRATATLGRMEDVNFTVALEEIDIKLNMEQRGSEL